MEKKMNDLRDKKSTGTLKFFQKIFVAYGLIFGGFWLKFDYIFHLEMNIPLFIITYNPVNLFYEVSGFFPFSGTFFREFIKNPI